MGEPQGGEATSLERLKALDSLPDLSSRLQEAQTLCNHSSRAEMIMRWLLGKLKSSSEVRTTAQSWSLLSSCARLLSPQRLASLLLPGGFIDILQTTSDEPELDIETISNMSGLWGLLFELGHTQDGTAVLSLLSVKSTMAAALCGNWMRHVYTTFEASKKPISTLFGQSLLTLGLQVWNLRRRQASDDVLFNSICLVSTCLLLVLIRELTPDLSVKRKRDRGSQTSDNDYTGSLEALVARHTILPARATFFKKPSREGRRKKILSVEVPQTDIADALGSLGQALIRAPSHRTFESVPLVLDIALRSVATPTPRHRFTERPWIESVFASLCDLVSHNEQTDVSRAITTMLRSIKHRNASLPSQMLLKLVKQHAITEQLEQGFDWDMIAEVCALDCSVFIDGSLCVEVFKGVSARQQQADAAEIGDLKTRIVIPVMKAYAQSRSMRSFMDIWHEQLLQETQSGPQSLWPELCSELAELLASSQASNETLAAIDRYASSMQPTEDAGSDLGDKATIRQLRADFVLLRGLLDGCQSEDLTLKIQGRLDTMRISLSSLRDIGAGAGTTDYHNELWRLSTSVFELWFPSWAAQQTERNEIAEMGVVLFESSVFKSAVLHVQTNKASNVFAQTFIGSLCSRFSRYNFHSRCSALCKAAVESLCKQLPIAGSVFTKYPALLQSLSSELARDVAKSVRDAATNFESDALHISAHATRRLILDDALAAMKDQRNTKRATRHHSADEASVFNIVSTVKASELEPQERATILNTLLSLPSPKMNEGGLQQLKERLAATLRLLSQPCDGAELLSDATKLWDFLQLFQEPKSKKKNADSLAAEAESAIPLLGEIARVVLRHWIATRRQSQDVLVAASERVKAEVETLSGRKGEATITQQASLCLVGVSFELLESAASGQTIAFGHRQPEVVRRLLDMLLAEAKTLLPQAQDSDPGQGFHFLGRVLDTLLDLPNSVIELLDGKASDTNSKIEELARGFLQNAQDNDRSSYDSVGILAKCYQLACKYGPGNAPDLKFAGKALRFDLSASNHYAVLQAFEDQVKSSTAEVRVAIVEGLVSENGSISLAALTLYRRAVRILGKDDIELATGFSAHELVPRLSKLATETSNIHVRKSLLQLLSLVFKEKPFMVNQYGVEQAISSMHRILSNATHVEAFYLDTCQVLGVLLAQYRARLQGRYHLMVGLFQALVSAIFSESKSDAFQESRARHSRTLARLLETFCNPPHVRHSNKSSDLVDEARRAQAHAGQYVQYILHHYCSQVLASAPADGVREALLPGLWAVIEAVEANNPEGIRVLSSMMNNSERPIRRSLYDDWKRFGKWEGM